MVVISWFIGRGNQCGDFALSTNYLLNEPTAKIPSIFYYQFYYQAINSFTGNRNRVVMNEIEGAYGILVPI